MTFSLLLLLYQPLRVHSIDIALAAGGFSVTIAASAVAADNAAAAVIVVLHLLVLVVPAAGAASAHVAASKYHPKTIHIFKLSMNEAYIRPMTNSISS